VSRSVTEFCKALNRNLPNFIKFPTRRQEIYREMNCFFNLNNRRGIPCVVGLIDGTHVQIQSPPADEAAYVNRLSYHSINVQIVTNHGDKITNLVPMWRGSVHDSIILRECSLWKYFETDPDQENSLLLGDSGYHVRHWLLTPSECQRDHHKRAIIGKPYLHIISISN
jgi:hypothetical protein